MPRASLKAIKLAHICVWAFFAACVVVIPVASWRGEHGIATGQVGIVFVEVVVLAVNAWRCPLTSRPATYSDDRRDNFDFHLPLWLARNNQRVFGGLYVVGIGVAFLAVWLRDSG